MTNEERSLLAAVKLDERPAPAVGDTTTTGGDVTLPSTGFSGDAVPAAMLLFGSVLLVASRRRSAS